MPDLRDDLGRLADFVGESRALDDLAAARRRRERRRRAEGLVAGIAVVLATALFLVSTFRSPTLPVPGDSATPTDGFEVPAVPYLWPENWADSTGDDALAATEASVMAGDADAAWRLDAEQVVRRFTAAVLGWSDLSVHGQQSGSDTQWWQVSPACPGGGCDPSMLETVRVDRLTASGVWVVTSVEASGLRAGFGHGINAVSADALAPRLQAGDTVSYQLDVPLGRKAHIGLVTYDGCSMGTSMNDALASGSYSLPVPEQNDPACTGDRTGYEFTFTTDESTVPVEDPLLEPGAVEAPGLTVVPIVIAAPDAARVEMTSYTDPLGWTIDVPTSWVVAPIDGSDGQFAFAGAIFASAEPQPEPLTPSAFTLPPGAVSLEVYNVSGDLYDCTHKDSTFPLSFQDFELPKESDHAGGIYGRFWGGGCQFTLSGSSSADATPEQNDTLRRMVASIRFEPAASQTQTPIAIDCGTQPTAQPTIVGKDIALAGCTSWPADEPIGILFDVRDAGIPMGLELFLPSACDQNGCSGKALWAGDLIVGRNTTTYHLEPLDAGSYVLVDAVHPTARLEITVR